MENLKRILASEGLDARNIVSWRVPNASPTKASNDESRSGLKEGSSQATSSKLRAQAKPFIPTSLRASPHELSTEERAALSDTMDTKVKIDKSVQCSVDDDIEENPELKSQKDEKRIIGGPDIPQESTSNSSQPPLKTNAKTEAKSSITVVNRDYSKDVEVKRHNIDARATGDIVVEKFKRNTTVGGFRGGHTNRIMTAKKDADPAKAASIKHVQKQSSITPSSASTVTAPTALIVDTNDAFSEYHFDNVTSVPVTACTLPLTIEDERLQEELALASEAVWAQAEAWVDAEAAVEDAAWEVLIARSRPKGDNRGSINSQQLQDSDTGTSGAVTPASHDDAFDSPIAEQTPTIQVSNLGSCKMGKSEPLSPASSPSSTTLQTPNNKPGYMQYNFATPSPSSGGSRGLSLHTKLSSPDRNRTRNLSPTEARRRSDARLTAAETMRDKNFADRRQKAMMNSTRVRLIWEREAQRLAQIDQALVEKLREAERRHSEYLKVVKGKAENENMKVSEIMFINSLNEESLAEELQQRLEEVEARILAASQRRHDRLADITVRQKKRNSRKSQQMSNLRLKIEQEKSERWEKLQTRLSNVQRRRQDRLDEISKRSSTGSGMETPPTEIIPLNSTSVESFPFPPLSGDTSNLADMVESLAAGDGHDADKKSKKRKKRKQASGCSADVNSIVGMHVPGSGGELDTDLEICVRRCHPLFVGTQAQRLASAARSQMEEGHISPAFCLPGKGKIASGEKYAGDLNEIASLVKKLADFVQLPTALNMSSPSVDLIFKHLAVLFRTICEEKNKVMKFLDPKSGGLYLLHVILDLKLGVTVTVDYFWICYKSGLLEALAKLVRQSVEQDDGRFKEEFIGRGLPISLAEICMILLQVHYNFSPASTENLNQSEDICSILVEAWSAFTAIIKYCSFVIQAHNVGVDDADKMVNMKPAPSIELNWLRYPLYLGMYKASAQVLEFSCERTETTLKSKSSRLVVISLWFIISLSESMRCCFNDGHKRQSTVIFRVDDLYQNISLPATVAAINSSSGAPGPPTANLFREFLGHARATHMVTMLSILLASVFKPCSSTDPASGKDVILNIGTVALATDVLICLRSLGRTDPLLLRESLMLVDESGTPTFVSLCTTLDLAVVRLSAVYSSRGLDSVIVESCLYELFQVLGLLYLPAPHAGNSSSGRTSTSVVPLESLLSLCRLPMPIFMNERLKGRLLPAIIASLYSRCSGSATESAGVMVALKREISPRAFLAFLQSQRDALGLTADQLVRAASELSSISPTSLTFIDCSEKQSQAIYMSHCLPVELWNTCITILSI